MWPRIFAYPHRDSRQKPRRCSSSFGTYPFHLVSNHPDEPVLLDSCPQQLQEMPDAAFFFQVVESRQLTA